MVRLKLIIIFTIAFIGLVAMPANADYVLQPSNTTLDPAGLSHMSYYIWEINQSLLPGETIYGAQLLLENVRDYEEDDVMFVHLLTPSEIAAAVGGMTAIAPDVYRGDEPFPNTTSDFFAGSELLTTFSDIGPSGVDLMYSFDASEIALLQTLMSAPGGVFGVAVDPDCHYYTDGITLNIVTTPSPGAILLGSIGVGLVGWLRKRRTL